jgi:hypothetical protein
MRRLFITAFYFTSCVLLSAADSLDTLLIKQSAAEALIAEGKKDIAYGGLLSREQDVHLGGALAEDNSGRRESGQQRIESGQAKVEEGTRELADINAKIKIAKDNLRVHLAMANFHLWHDKTGRAIRAELIVILANKIHIMRDDGVEFFLSRDLLSAEDNAWLKRCEITAQLTTEVAADKSTVLDAVSADDLDFNWRDKQGYNALMYAVLKGNLGSVKKLVALGYPISDRQDLLDTTSGIVYRGAGPTAGEMVGLNPHADLTADSGQTQPDPFSVEASPNANLNAYVAVLGPVPNEGISVESQLKDYAGLENDPEILAEYNQLVASGSSKEPVADMTPSFFSLLHDVDLYQSSVVPSSFTVVDSLPGGGFYEIRLDGYADVCVLQTEKTAFITKGHSALPLEFVRIVPIGEMLPDEPVILFREQVVRDKKGNVMSPPELANAISSQCRNLMASLKNNTFPAKQLVDFYEQFKHEGKNTRRAGPSILVGNGGALTEGPDAAFYNQYYGVKEMTEFNALRYALLKNIFDHWKQ